MPGQAIRRAPATFPQFGEEYLKQLTAERLGDPDRQGLPAWLLGEGAWTQERGARLPRLRPRRSLDHRCHILEGRTDTDQSL